MSKVKAMALVMAMMVLLPLLIVLFFWRNAYAYFKSKSSKEAV